MRPILLILCLAGTIKAGDVTIDGHKFRVPDGFTIEKVAGPPLVNRPIVADFDEQGRLYVADSSGSNDAPAKQLENPTHRIVRLEDTNGDGTYDKSVVFADKMMFPEGAMWRDGSLYVAAPPSIWKLTDTDGDGKCDKREEWFKGKTLTGCANDLHGPYNGPDGWIYWTKGAFAEQTYTLPNGKPFKTRAAHIFRAKPDGTGIEPVITGGMDNPVEIAWSPGGELFFTTTFLQHPGGGKRDGIIHGIYGGVYGKDHDVLDGQIRTGPDLMPVMTHLGPAAPSGLMRYESSALGTAYKDNLFCAQFNMHKVSRHILEPAGATFKTTDSDFLSVADHHDFHPTDVLEDADGSVLVLDTGGWYKLCCPTSQIGKPDVLGGIYRVRRINAETFDDPRGLKIGWKAASPEGLVAFLGDPRWMVRRRAVAELGSRKDSVEALSIAVRGDFPAEMRRNAVWASARIDGGPAARELSWFAALDGDASIREVGWHVIALLRDQEREHEDRFLRLFAMEILYNRYRPRTSRLAAEAIGRRRQGDNAIWELVTLIDNNPGDRLIEHSVAYALLELDRPDELLAALDQAHDNQAPVILIAIDQSGQKIPLKRLHEALVSKVARSREVAEWIVGRHTEYANDLGPEHLGNLLEQGEVADFERQAAKFSRSAKVREMLGATLRSKDLGSQETLAALRAAEKSGLQSLPDEWRDGLTMSLASSEPEIAKQAIATARALPSANNGASELASALKKIGERNETPADIRLEALDAMPGGPGGLSQATFAFLREQLDPEKPVSTRLASASVLAKAALSMEQIANVAEALKTAGPLDAPRLLAVFDKATDDTTGLRIIVALKESLAISSLRAADLKTRFAKFGEPVRKEAESLYAIIDKANADQLAKLDDLAKAIPDGDVIRGQAVFNGSKAACLSCHAIGYVGGQIGPDLSRIGSIRNDRDLLESIVFPSASFVRSYEPMVVATKAGQVHSGIVKKDSADEVVLVAGADKEIRVPRAEVEEMKPGTVSVMPSGLDSQMTKSELADLIAFLRSRK